jgi:hypothetical protein
MQYRAVPVVQSHVFVVGEVQTAIACTYCSHSMTRLGANVTCVVVVNRAGPILRLGKLTVLSCPVRDPCAPDAELMCLVTTSPSAPLHWAATLSAVTAMDLKTAPIPDVWCAPTLHPNPLFTPRTPHCIRCTHYTVPANDQWMGGSKECWCVLY